MELESQTSQHFQAIVPQNHYGGSYNNIIGGGNIDLFDQGSMIDRNLFSYNPNMSIPYHDGPMLGYNNNNNAFERFNHFKHG